MTHPLESKSVFVFKKGREYAGMWAFPLPEQAGDFDNQVFNSKDNRTIYTATFPKEVQLEKALATVQAAIAALSAALPGTTAEFIDMRGANPEECARRMMTAPWAHVAPTAPGGSA